MIIAHLADVHLGYRAYARLTRDGRNQREVDVAEAFGRAVQAIAGLRPDLVVVAGDLFHSVRPSNAAIAAAFRGISTLAAELAPSPIVVVAGDRETPRAADTSSILELLREIPRVHAVTGGVEQLSFTELDLEVVAIPHAALLGDGHPVLPEPTEAATRVLVAHGHVVGGVGGGSASPSDGGASIDASVIEGGRWDYVALGHLPAATEVAPNVWYAGALEHTSPDPWTTAGAERGLVAFDTAAGAATFHPLPTRTVLDLPRVSARGLDAAGVSRAIESVLREVPGGLRGKIVRLVVTDLPRSELRRLDGEVLRAARAEALHFLLEARPPPRPTPATVLSARGATLESQVEEYLGRVWEPTMDGIDRATLVRLARGYLAEATDGGGAGE